MRLLGIRPFLLAALVLSAMTLAACGSGSGSDGGESPDVDDASRVAVLAALADNVYVPAYQRAAESSDSLLRTLRQLEADPSEEALLNAREAWKSARLNWSRTLAFDFGPSDRRRSMSLVDWMPVEPDKIERTLERRDSFDAAFVLDFLGSSQRGLGAIEHLLFSEESDAAQLEALSEASAKRLKFTLALAEVIAEELVAVSNSWTAEVDGEFAYRDVFTGEAPVSLFVNAAVAETVRSPVFLLQTIADMQIAPVIGMAGEPVDLSGLPSLPSGFTWEDTRARIESVQSAYAGGEQSPGISGLVSQLSRDTDARMRQALSDVLNSIDATTMPIEQAAFDAPDQVIRVFDSLKNLQRILNTEVVSLLGVSVGFSDNDGDSSN